VIHQHLKEIDSRNHGTIKSVACDPSGNGPNDQTALSNVQQLRQKGYVVRSRGSRINEGLEMIRADLAPAFGKPRLYIHPRCRRVIEAFQSYRYADHSETPLKDNIHDHPMDALRYFYVNAATSGLKVRQY
jgi:hypothetical protein